MNTIKNENENKYNLTEIVKDNSMAKLSHAIAGVLYYEVTTTTDAKYMFPVDMNNQDDVGTATFPSEIKAITLMRYIRKAMDNGAIIKIK